MKSTLLTYSVAKQPQKIRDQLRMGLIGHTNKSNWGKYTYKRKGLLNQIRHIRISKGTIIVPLKDTDKIISFLNKFNTEIEQYIIDINQKYFKK